MPRSAIEPRTSPKEQVSTPIEKHNREMGTLNRDINRAEAREDARPRSPEESRARHFAAAKDRLDKLTYAQTMDFLTAMPVGVLEMYLLAEEDGKNREEVLRYFPKPGVKARSRWLPELTAPVGA